MYSSSLLFGNSPSEIMLSVFEWQLQIISHFWSRCVAIAAFFYIYIYYHNGCHPWLAQRLTIKLHEWSDAALGHMLTRRSSTRHTRSLYGIQMITKHNRHQLSWTRRSDRGFISVTRIQILCKYIASNRSDIYVKYDLTLTMRIQDPPRPVLQSLTSNIILWIN